MRVMEKTWRALAACNKATPAADLAKIMGATAGSVSSVLSNMERRRMVVSGLDIVGGHKRPVAHYVTVGSEYKLQPIVDAPAYIIGRHVKRKPAETATAQPVEVVKPVVTFAAPAPAPATAPAPTGSEPVYQAFGGKTAKDFVESLTIKEWRQLRAALEESTQ